MASAALGLKLKSPLWAASAEGFGSPFPPQMQGLPCSTCSPTCSHSSLLRSAPPAFCASGPLDCSPSPTVGFPQIFAYVSSPQALSQGDLLTAALPDQPNKEASSPSPLTPPPSFIFIAMTTPGVENQCYLNSWNKLAPSCFSRLRNLVLLLTFWLAAYVLLCISTP